MNAKKPIKPLQKLENNPSHNHAFISTTISSFVGPLPPPEILQNYERICPGSADRILKMAESQTQHRQQLEKRVIFSNVVNERLGIISSAIITLTLIIGGISIILLGKNIPSGITGFLAIFAPSIFQAYNFYKRKNVEKKELKRKEQEINK